MCISTMIAFCLIDTVVRHQSCNVGNEDDRNHIRQQRLVIEITDNALASSPFELLLA